MPKPVLCPVCSTGLTSHPNIRCSSGCAPVRVFGVAGHTLLPTFVEAIDLISQTLHDSWGSEAYRAATAHGVSSSVIQQHVEIAISKASFVREQTSKVGLAGFRADFVDTKGHVIVEVERGKTIDNNMDMLDMWKCHVHPTATHLILVVPVWYETGKSVSVVRASTFAKVCNRLELFFRPENLTNVKATAIIGY